MYVKPSLRTWDESQLVVVYELFDVFLDLVGLILLRIFVPMFIKYIGLYFYFFVVYFSVFGSRVMVASEIVLGLIPFSATFWKSSRRMGISSFCMFGRICQ